MKIALIFLLTSSFSICVAADSSPGKAFISGCDKMMSYFSAERKKQQLPPIDKSFDCKVRAPEKLSIDYFQRLSRLPDKAQESAGCSFAVSAYISGYRATTSVEKKALYAAISGDDEAYFKVAAQYCRNASVSF